MRPRLEACYFGAGPHGMWDRLANVLRFTADTHCPSWNVTVRRINPVPRESALGLGPNVANTQKLEEWVRLVTEASDGERMLLIDADTAILRPLDDIWDREFDLAYTTRYQARTPFNGGVVFVRVSPAIRAFFTAWWAENLAMLGDAAYHQQYRLKYFGLNQAAFGALLEREALANVTVLELSCLEWNCEDTSWKRFDPDRTRILHVKDGITQDDGNLRKAIFRGDTAPARVQALAERWKQLEADANRAAQRRTA